jgi:Ni,Fe-hydrogenase maturation factor
MVEDALLIADYKTVYFVDANKTVLKEGFLIEQIYASKEVTFSTHAVPPNQILNLCENLFNKKPTAYVVKIEGTQWNIKLGLTKKASINLKNSFEYFIKHLKNFNLLPQL